jgi:hypothetical protein
MATDNQFGKGIGIAAGFDLGAKKPLDSRDVVGSIEEMNAHIENNRAYEGMQVYVEEEKKIYICLTNEDGSLYWEKYTALMSQDDLDEMVNDIFKDEIIVDDEVVETSTIKVIKKSQIDDIVGSVF